MIRQRATACIPRASNRSQWLCPACRPRRFATKNGPKSEPARVTKEPPDHRKLGVQQGLFMTSKYSPGSPIFLPRGTLIFNRLVDFLRKQYVRYGFQEVITPTIYKKALWAKSGHLENYGDDMYSVTGYTSHRNTGCCDNEEGKEPDKDDDGEYGLKPMNCPGHCLIFASENRSYRDLPIRYADFSPLHRNEISGALSGLTRVRRFHQDDGHIFCRPSQVEDEIKNTLDFVDTVYKALRLNMSYRLALSTRPRDHFIGSVEEWDRAEDALRRALDKSGMEWSVNEGDGAFYGPKIDIVLKDSDGKEHQTATVQLDFQLPKRFELEYQAPAPEYEARAEMTDDPAKLAEYGAVRPVMIHRAVLGSVERLMAILIESYDGKWPFWLHPRQVIILALNEKEPTLAWTKKVKDVLLGNEPSAYRPTGLSVDVDSSARPLGQKIKAARTAGYGHVLIVGDKDVEKGVVTDNQFQKGYPPEELRSILVEKARALE